MTRLKAHHSNHNATHHSELSQFMRLGPESMCNIFIFPIHQHMNPSAIAKAGLAFIDEYPHQKRSRMLNRTTHKKPSSEDRRTYETPKWQTLTTEKLDDFIVLQ
jgi:hypothetical protein